MFLQPALTQPKSKDAIPNTWLLLDSQSTVDVVTNRRLLKNIRKAPRRLRIRCNAGDRLTNMVGHLPGYGTVWYLEDGIANILSLAKVRKKHHVTYDSWDDDVGFVVEKKDGTNKGGTCADDRKPRDCVNEKDSASPTVSTKAVSLTGVVEAKVERKAKVEKTHHHDRGNSFVYAPWSAFQYTPWRSWSASIMCFCYYDCLQRFILTYSAVDFTSINIMISTHVFDETLL